jgi:hypothetical protein
MLIDVVNSPYLHIKKVGAWLFPSRMVSARCNILYRYSGTDMTPLGCDQLWRQD